MIRKSFNTTQLFLVYISSATLQSSSMLHCTIPILAHPFTNYQLDACQHNNATSFIIAQSQTLMNPTTSYHRTLDKVGSCTNYAESCCHHCEIFPHDSRISQRHSLPYIPVSTCRCIPYYPSYTWAMTIRQKNLYQELIDSNWESGWEQEIINHERILVAINL